MDRNQNDKNNQKNSGSKMLWKMIRNMCICTLALLFCGWAIMLMTSYIDFVAEKKVQQIKAAMQTQQAVEKEELGGNSLNDIVISEDGVTKEDVSEVAEKGMNAVVSLVKYDVDTDNEYNFIAAGSGSGVIIGDNEKEVWIVTNYHVIQDARKLTATLYGQQTVDVFLKGYDKNKDIAVLSIPLDMLEENVKKNIQVAKIDAKRQIANGQTILAIGDAFGQGKSVTKGIISAKNSQVLLENGQTIGAIQVDAALNKGCSGGAIFDMEGYLLGIITAKSIEDTAENIGFAIAVADIEEDLQEMCAVESKKLTLPKDAVYMGVEVIETNMGVLVQSFTENGPASKSDLNVGDYFVSIDGVKIDNTSDIYNILNYKKAGEFIKVIVQRPAGKSYALYELSILLEARK